MLTGKLVWACLSNAQAAAGLCAWVLSIVNGPEPVTEQQLVYQASLGCSLASSPAIISACMPPPNAFAPRGDLDKLSGVVVDEVRHIRVSWHCNGGVEEETDSDVHVHVHVQALRGRMVFAEALSGAAAR